MKKCLLVVLIVLLPTFAFAQPVPVTTIGEDRPTEATSGESLYLTIENIDWEQVLEQNTWEKYFYVDLSQDLDEEVGTIWTRLGVRNEKIDFSLGWSKEMMGGQRGIVDLSFSVWWE